MSASTGLVTRTTQQACTILADVLGFKHMLGCAGAACAAEATEAVLPCSFFSCNVSREATCPHSAPEFNQEAKTHVQQHLSDLAAAAAAKAAAVAAAAAAAEATVAAAVAAGASCNYHGCDVCREKAASPYFAPTNHNQARAWTHRLKAAAATTCKLVGCNTCHMGTTCATCASEYRSFPLSAMQNASPSTSTPGPGQRVTTFLDLHGECWLCMLRLLCRIELHRIENRPN
jgi:hypothetical protein